MPVQSQVGLHTKLLAVDQATKVADAEAAKVFETQTAIALQGLEQTHIHDLNRTVVKADSEFVGKNDRQVMTSSW